MFLTDGHGRFLTAPRYAAGGPRLTGSTFAETRPQCAAGAGEIVDIDYRGLRTFHGFRPVPALGSACVEAHIAYDDALAPAKQLRADLACVARCRLLGVSSRGRGRLRRPVRSLVTAARRCRRATSSERRVAGP